MKNLFAALLILSIFSAPSFAFFRSIGMTPLKIKMSARPLSLGEAFSAIPDIDSQFYNPGCMPWTKGISINMQNFSNIAVSQAYPTGNDMTLGLAFAYNKSSGLRVTGGGTAEIQGSVMIFTYSTKLSSLLLFQNDDLFRSIGIGASFKFLLNEGMFQQGQFDKNGSGYDLDAGIYYKASPWLSFGAVGGNILPYKTFGGGVIKWKGIEGEESIPAFYKVGTSAKVIGDLRSPIFVQDQELNISADIEKTVQSAAKIELGLEYSYSNTYSLRAGITSSNEASIGLGYKASGWGVNLSYSKDAAVGNNVFYANIIYFPEEWHFLSHPFEYLKPEDGFETYDSSCEVAGKVKPGITLTVNEKQVDIKQDRTFSHIVDLSVGQNIITAETLYENDRLSQQINVLRKELPKEPIAYINMDLPPMPAAPAIERPKPVKTKIHKVKHAKKKYIKKKHFKRVDKNLLKNFKQVQKIIKEKTSLTILSEAEIRLSGYFAVYVLSDFQYIALRDLRNGLISIDYYETARKSWKTLATAPYGELLLFKTSSQGKIIDFYLDN